MLGLSSGLVYNNPVSDDLTVYTYASNWWQFDSAYALYINQGWQFNPCSLSEWTVGLYPTGGNRNNDNHIMVVYFAGAQADSCMTWQGTLLSSGELDGGLINGDVVTFSYEMFLASGDDKWSPGDGSDVPIETTISGFDTVTTNFTPQDTPNAVYTEVRITATKSGGAQDEGLNVSIGPFDQAQTNATVFFRRVNATVSRTG